MPIMTMLVTKRPPSFGTRPPVGGVPPGQSPSRSRATSTCPTISPAVRLRTSRCVPVWQNEQVERAADLARNAQRAAAGVGNVDALDLVRPLARVFAGQPQQPLAGAVDRDLLGDDLRPREREALRRARRAAPSTRWSCPSKRRARRGHRSSARAAARASCAASPARRSRRAPRPAARAIGRPARAAPAAHSAPAAVFSIAGAASASLWANSISGIVRSG